MTPSCWPCRTTGTRWWPSRPRSNKKDIYGEKPLARTIAEQQAIVKAVEKNKCIWQTGSWQRSQAPFRKAAEIVRNGLIGKVTHVEVGLPSGHHDFAGLLPPAGEIPGAQDPEIWPSRAGSPMEPRGNAASD